MKARFIAQTILILILIGIGGWCGYKVANIGVNAMKESGGIVFAKDIVGQRIAGTVIGAFIGFVIALFFVKSFNN